LIKRLLTLGCLLGALICPTMDVFGQDVSQYPLMPFGTLNDSDNPLVLQGNMAQDLLNVDISPGGLSIIKREGYSLQHDLTITTSPVHGIYNFFDSNGNEVQLYFNDGYVSASVGGTYPDVLLSTQTLDATWQCTDGEGYAYCVTNGRNGLLKTNGVSYSWIIPVATGTMVTMSQTRMAMAGFSDYPNRVDFSGSVDFTDWVLGTEDYDPINFTIVAPGAKITHLTYAFGKFIWFKENSFGFILEGDTLDDWMIRTISPNVGTVDNTSVYYNGILYFRGNDSHIYAYDGSNLTVTSKDISTLVDSAQSKLSNSWSQSSYSDFTTGSSITASGYLTVSQTENSIFLTTGTPPTSLVDTSEADFSSGTVSNTTTTVVPGSVLLEFISDSTNRLDYSASTSAANAYCLASPDFGISQQFIATHTFHISSITIGVDKVDAGGIGDWKIQLRDDNSNTPGILLQEIDLLATDIPAGASLYSTNFATTTKISSGTAYWISLVFDQGSGSCSLVGPTTRIAWDQLDVAGPFDTYSTQTPALINTNKRHFLEVYGIGYSTSGFFTSRPHNVDLSTDTWLWSWGILESTEVLNSQSITYETQTATSSTGVWESLVSVSGGIPISSVKEYIRYRANLLTTDSSTSPIINDVTINMGDKVRPEGIYYSPVHDTQNVTSWDSFSSDYSLNNGTIDFYVRASTGEFSVNSTTPTWTSVSNGDIPSISTGIYYQNRADFSVTHSTQEPILNSFTQNWFEGAADDKSYAIYFDDGIWWSITAGDGATYNNKVLRLDLQNNGFTVYDIPANGYLVRAQNLYFGSSVYGKIYKFGDVDSDDGSDIEAYWKSKDYSAGLPFQDKELVNVSLAADSVENSTVTVSYQVGSTESSYNVPLEAPGEESTKYNKNIPSGTYGQIMNFKIGNDASDQPFEIFGFQIGIRAKPWRPTP